MTMLLRCELKKAWLKRVNRVALVVALLAIVVFSVFAIGSFDFVDSEGTPHTGVSAARSLVEDKNQWRGELTPEVISQAIERYRDRDWQSTYEIVFLASKMLRDEDGDSYDYEVALGADPVRIGDIYDSYQTNLQAECEKYGKTPEQVEYLMGKYERIETPFSYEAFDTWDTMLLYATTVSIVLVVVIGFLTAGIFAEEFRYKSDAVFFSARYGRTRATRAKACAGLIVATAVYWIGIGLLSAVVFAAAGVSGASTPYQIVYPYSIYPVTFSQMYGMVVLGGYVGSLLSAGVSMLVASKTRSASVAVCIPFLLFCVSPFLGRALPFKTLFTLTPDQLNNVMNCSRIPYVYQVGGTVFSQIPFIFLLYAAIALVLVVLAKRTFGKAMLR